MQWVYDDGGRAAAGFKGKANDCVARAAAIITGKPYAEVYAELNKLAAQERPRGANKRSSARTGIAKQTYRRYLESLGGVWTPTMQIGSGCKVHLEDSELPQGRLIVSVSRHIVAVIAGIVHDTHDPTREGNRCVYGYWTFPDNPVQPPTKEQALPTQLHWHKFKDAQPLMHEVVLIHGKEIPDYVNFRCEYIFAALIPDRFLTVNMIFMSQAGRIPVDLVDQWARLEEP